MIVKPKKFDLEGNDLKDAVQAQANEVQEKYKHVLHEGYVGFGKTKIGINVIKRVVDDSLPFDMIQIICPAALTTKWEKIMEELIPNGEVQYKVSSINSYTIQDENVTYNVKLLLVDEAHKILNKDSQFFSTALKRTNAEEVCLLSGSLMAHHRTFVKEHGITTTFEVSKLWGYKNNLVPKYNLLNIPVILTLKEKSDYADAQESIRRVEMYLIGGGIYDAYTKADSPLINEAADELGLTPGQVMGKLMQWQKLIRIRQGILYNAYNKKAVLKAILKEITPEQAFIFCGSIQFADALERETDTVIAMHSKLTVKNERRAMTLFETGEKPHIASISKLKEGIDYKHIRWAIRSGYTSTTTDTEQIGGRIIRLDEENPDKEAWLVTLVVQSFEAYGKIIDSQEEVWLRKSQANEHNIFYANDSRHGIDLIKQIMAGEPLDLNRGW